MQLRPQSIKSFAAGHRAGECQGNRPSWMELGADHSVSTVRISHSLLCFSFVSWEDDEAPPLWHIPAGERPWAPGCAAPAALISGMRTGNRPFQPDGGRPSARAWASAALPADSRTVWMDGGRHSDGRAAPEQGPSLSATGPSLPVLCCFRELLPGLGFQRFCKLWSWMEELNGTWGKQVKGW